MWEVARTWAFSVGAVEARSHLSLLETTFFNWDAILYDWRSGSLHHRQDYFSDLSERYLELVLEDNPNAVGAFVRTLRTLSLADEIVTGPRLSKFIVNGFSELADDEILKIEKQSFGTKRLSSRLLSELRDKASLWRTKRQFHWIPK